MTANAPDRRQFLALVALIAARLQPGGLAAQGLRRVGFHLGSARAAVAADLPGILETIAAIGYREVEFRFPDGVPMALLEVRRLLDRLSLAAPSRHVAMADVFSNWRRVLNDCRVLGNRHVVCEEIPAQERSTLQGYQRVAGLLNAAGKITQWAGVQLVLQPHTDDFRPRGGLVPFDYLIANTNPAFVKLQMDLSVMRQAARDPLEDFARHRDRFVSLHLNEMNPDVSQGQPARPAPDLATVIARAQRAGVQHVFVDDERPDPTWEHAKENFAYLSTLELK